MHRAALAVGMAQILPSRLCQWLLLLPPHAAKLSRSTSFSSPLSYLGHQKLSFIKCFIYRQATAAANGKLTFTVQSSNLSQATTKEEELLENLQESSEKPSEKSRNQKKKEAARAVKWGKQLAKFSPKQIKTIIKVVSLHDEVFNAVMLAKRLGPDVREGKRRQFNYIGGLLRKAQPDLMETVLQAMRDGEMDKFYAQSGIDKQSIDEYVELEEDEIKEEEEMDKEALLECEETAKRWSEGLISGDASVTKEVYSIYSIDYDRQELRKLVREVRAKQEYKILEETYAEGNATEKEENFARTEVDKALSQARKSLYNFLFWLAKQSSVNAY